VTDASGAPVAGVYATGWIKRGPVGLIGHTKGDALETITNLVADASAGVLAADGVAPTVAAADGDEVLELLESREVPYTTWNGWLALDAHERGLGEAFEGPVARERVKVVPREDQVDVSRSGALVAG
jgi:ferredoxin--NADP+ reductase